MKALGRIARLTRSKRFGAGLTVVLAIAALASFAFHYADHRQTALRAIEASDVFHYYLNAKYFDELAYHRLYACAYLADRDGEQLLRTRQLRRLTDYRTLPADEVAAEMVDECRASFAPERWRQFVHDVTVLARATPRSLHQWALTDRGFNGTPGWLSLATPLARAVPVEQVHWLARIDLVLLLVALAFVRRAYGTRVALVACIALFTMWSTSWPRIGLSFLRYDWVAASVVSVCLLRRQRHALAGAVAAWAVLSRLVPAVLVAAVALKALAHVELRRGVPLSARFPPRYLRFFGALAVTSALVVGWSSLVVGPESFAASRAKLTTHSDVEFLSHQRVGLAMALVFRGELERDDVPPKWFTAKKRALRDWAKWTARVIALLAALLLVPALRRRGDDEAMALGGVLVFLAAILSSYYFVVLLPMVVLHAARAREPRHAVGLALLFALSPVVFFVDHRTGFRYGAMGVMSWHLTAYAAFVLVTAGFSTTTDATSRPPPPRPAS